MKYKQKDFEPKTKISDRIPAEFAGNTTNMRIQLFKFRNY